MSASDLIRLLTRSRKVFLIVTTRLSVRKNGEISPFSQQFCLSSAGVSA